MTFYTFANATTAIPLSNLDSNFATPITLGNTAVTINGTFSSIGNLTLNNATIASGNSTVTKETVTTITSPAATNLTIQSASTTAVTIDTSQNVGIGTSSPGVKLDISGQSIRVTGYQPFITFRDTNDSNKGSQIQSYSGNTLFENDATGGGTYTERMRIDSSGNVGIGTSSPTNIFTVKSATQFKGMSVNNGTNDIVQLIGQGTGNDNGSVILLNGGTAGAYIQASGNSYFNGGNVGIGTTSPGTYGKFAVTASSGNIGYFEGTASSANINNIVLNATATNSAPTMTMQVNGGTTAIGQVRLFGDSSMLFLNGTSPTEKMRIDSSGELLVGITSFPTTAGQTGSGISPNGQVYLAHAGTSFWTHMNFINSNGSVGAIATNGSNTSFNTSSDYRLKENVVSMTGGIATVSALKPVKYDWISNKEQGEGFIAHELQAVIPLAVHGEKDAVNEDGSIKPQGVDYSKIVVHLVAALQELSAKVDAQADEITALKAKVGA